MIEILKDEPLSKHTFYGVGGPADEFWHVKSLEGFGEIWAETIASGIPYFVLGKGFNTLFSDKGFRGRVFSFEYDKVSWKENFVTVEAGKNWQDFVEESNKKGFGDLCNLSGIPGNAGGFVRGNSGAFGVETGDLVESVEFFNETGTLQKFPKSKCEFSYRDSIFKKHPEWCIVRVIFKLTKQENADQALQKSKTILADRWKKYPPGRSGGSFFKNPEPGKIFAGELLERAGAKGDQIGFAQISERHANFIMNLQSKATQKTF